MRTNTFRWLRGKDPSILPDNEIEEITEDRYESIVPRLSRKYYQSDPRCPCNFKKDCSSSFRDIKFHEAVELINNLDDIYEQSHSTSNQIIRNLFRCAAVNNSVLTDEKPEVLQLAVWEEIVQLYHLCLLEGGAMADIEKERRRLNATSKRFIPIYGKRNKHTPQSVFELFAELTWGLVHSLGPRQLHMLDCNNCCGVPTVSWDHLAKFARSGRLMEIVNTLDNSVLGVVSLQDDDMLALNVTCTPSKRHDSGIKQAAIKVYSEATTNEAVWTGCKPIEQAAEVPKASESVTLEASEGADTAQENNFYVLKLLASPVDGKEDYWMTPRLDIRFETTYGQKRQNKIRKCCHVL